MSFEKPTLEQWRALADRELGGAPFERKLIWRTPEGIPVQPLYTQADPPVSPQRGDGRGGSPVSPQRGDGRGGSPVPPPAGRGARPWQVRQEVVLEMAARELRGGADSVCLRMEPQHTAADLDRALSELDASTPVGLAAGSAWLPAGAMLAEAAERWGGGLRGTVWCDPIAALLDGAPARFGQLLAEARELHRLLPGHKTLTISSWVYHDAGACAVQELAFALAGAVDVLRRLGEAPPMEFHFSVSTNLYLELAKLRAARALWARIAGLLELEDRGMWLHVRSSRLDKGVLDRHTNLIRTAVEAFVGAVGGCDSMQVDPFGPDAQGRRLARNQQLVLRDEAGLSRVADAAGGSYLLESLTRALAQRAWELLQRVEAQGGLVACLEIGWPQQEIAAVAEGREEALRTGRTTLVGVNRYADPFEAQARRPKPSPAPSGAPVKQDLRQAVRAGACLGSLQEALRPACASDIAPLRPLRLAAPFEALRERALELRERTGSLPRAVLLPLGAVSARRARAGFSAGFLAAGGFEVLDGHGFDSVEEALAYARQADAPVAVVCSSDGEYPGLVASLAVGLGGRCLVVAGCPPDQERLRSDGADLFIHLQSDRVACLSALLDRVETSFAGGVRS